MASEITFNYTLTEKDYVKSSWAISRRLPRVWVGFVIASGVTVFAIYLSFWTDNSMAMSAGVSAILPVLAVGLWLLEWWTHLVRPKRLARAMPAVGIEHELSFSDEGVSGRSSLGSGNARWGHYTKAVETESYFLIFSGKQVYNPFPKRALSGPDEIAALRELIRVHVPNSKLLT